MRKFKKTFKDNFFPLLIFTLLVILFFAPLFYPQPKILSTPDYGRSDVWHFNYPIKDFLNQSLKNHQLPLWNKYLGCGQPIFAEGQIGTFFIPNLILFFLFPTHIAFNLGLCLIVFLAGIGTYLYCKAIKLDNTVSLFGAIIFGFGGFLIVHFIHFSLAQAVSLFPFLFFLSHRLLTKKKLIYTLPLAFTLSQQIFTGFPQVTFISLFGLSLYFLFFTLPKDRKNFKKISSYQWRLPFLLSSSILLGFLLSAVQLLPSYELKNLSGRKNDLSFEVATQYPYPLKNFISLVFPYFFGNPAKGTFPLDQITQAGLFWENTAYLGTISLFLFFLGIFFVKKRLKNFYLLLFIISILLVPGKYSPVYVLFFLKPFNIFRIPSRFLLLTSWSITILACLALQNLKTHVNKNFGQFKTKILLAIILSLSSVQLFLFAKGYNAYVNLSDWQTIPETKKFLNKEEDRVYSLMGTKPWNEIFYKNGWQEINPYLHLRNNLDVNLSSYYKVPHVSAYMGLRTLKTQIILTALKEGELLQKETITLNPGALKLLSLLNTKYLLSPYNIENSDLTKVFETETEKPTYKIYQNDAALPRIYLVKESKKISTLADFFKTLQEENFNPQQTVLLEKDFSSPELENVTSASWQSNDFDSSQIKILKDTHTELTLKVDPPQNAFLVVTDTYYPDWQASVDGKPQEIFVANFNQRAIFLKKGNHLVEFKFSPASFKYGAIISVTTFLIIIFLILARSLSSFFHKFHHKT